MHRLTTLYVDGGRDVLVESNVVHDVKFGMEVRERAPRPIDELRNFAEQRDLRRHRDRDRDRRLRAPPRFTQGSIIVNNAAFETSGVGLLVQFERATT